MVSESLYLGFLALVGLQRLGELVLTRRNTRRALAQGGVEYGRALFPWMKLLHTLFLAGCAVEVVALERPFLPALGLPMLLLALAAQGIRLASMRALGPHWNARVIVVPGMQRVTSGPYRWSRHPNYAAVVLEGFAIPLVHGAWITALVFSVLNAWLLRARIRCEERALAEHAVATPRRAAARPASARLLEEGT